MSSNVTILVSYGRDSLERVQQFRYEILRKPFHLPAQSAIFAGDEFDATTHLLAYSNEEDHSNGKIVGCASILFSDTEKRAQLRGMAVAIERQRRGIGKQILDNVIALAAAREHALWCNARLSAVGFYEHHGWVQVGEIFDIPVIGQHVVLELRGKIKCD